MSQLLSESQRFDRKAKPNRTPRLPKTKSRRRRRHGKATRTGRLCRGRQKRKIDTSIIYAAWPRLENKRLFSDIDQVFLRKRVGRHQLSSTQPSLRSPGCTHPPPLLYLIMVAIRKESVAKPVLFYGLNNRIIKQLSNCNGMFISRLPRNSLSVMDAHLQCTLHHHCYVTYRKISFDHLFPFCPCSRYGPNRRHPGQYPRPGQQRSLAGR